MNNQNNELENTFILEIACCIAIFVIYLYLLLPKKLYEFCE